MAIGRRKIKKLVQRLPSLHNEERGVVIVLVALSLVCLLGFVALVVDGGMMYETRRQLQNGVDGAALAGAWELLGDLNYAEAVAREYAAHNGISDGEITEVSFGYLPDGVNPYIRVTAERPVDLFFAPVLGIDTANVGASATAIVAAIQPEALWPWGVPEDEFGEKGSLLKLGAQFGENGNFRALDFPPFGGGAASYTDYIEEGWDDPGGALPPYPPPEGDDYSWMVDSEPGNMATTCNSVDYVLSMSQAQDPEEAIMEKWIIPDMGAFITDPDWFEANYDSSMLESLRDAGFRPHAEHWRTGYIPIVSQGTWDEASGKCEVEVIDFAAFYLIGCSEDQQGKKYVAGVFLDYAEAVGGGHKIGAPLKGLIGARLWR